MHQVKIEEIINGLKITETINDYVVVRNITSLAFPFIRSTNEIEETFQVIDKVGEIYNLPALATEFLLFDISGNSYSPGTGAELVEDSYNLEPFRKNVEIDKVVSLGAITTTSSNVALALPTSGVNSVQINNVLLIKSIPQNFPFTAVTTGAKILILYAVNDSNIFHLAEGAESSEAVEPTIPTGALFIARILVNISGQVIDTSPIKASDIFDNSIFASDNVRETLNTIYYSQNAESAARIAADLLKADLVGGVVPSYQLPSYVDDILEFANLAAFPTTGETGKIYVAISPKNQEYRWSGSTYIQITNGLIASTDDVPEGLNLYFTAARVLATVLTGISYVTGTAVVSTDSVLVAFGKLQKQITDALASISGKLDKPTTPNNTSEFVINGDNTTSPKGNFQRTLQVEISTNTTLDETHKGKEILVTATCTITIPATLSDSWSCDIGTLAGVTLTLAITTPKTWLFGTPSTIGEKTTFNIQQRGSTNDIIIYGL